MKKNAVGWFEIPVTDMNRAVSFYEAMLEIKLHRLNAGPLQMVLFPEGESGAGSSGALVFNKEYYKPSSEGVLVYFTAFSGDVEIELERAEKAGGTILMPKKQISPEYGYMALLLDTEGNRIALHSR